MNIQTLPSNTKLPAFAFLIFSLAYGTLLLPQEMQIYLTEEDGFFENLTAIFFLLTATGFFLLFINKQFFNSEALRNLYSSPGRRYVFLAFSLILFFGFAEEISWRQRLFGFETQEPMAAINAQGEFNNIHNLEIFDGKDVEGVPRSTWQRLFTMKQLFLYFFFGYLFVLPLLNRNNNSIRELLKRLMIPVPQIWLGVLFLENFIIYAILRIMLEGSMGKVAVHSLNEIEEFNFSLVLLCIPSVWFAISKKDRTKTKLHYK